LLECKDAQVGVMPLNLRQWIAFNQAAAASPRLSRLWAEPQAGASRTPESQSLRKRLAAAEPAARAALLQEVVHEQASHILRIPKASLALSAHLTQLGMDSLLGLELRNRIESVMGITVPATLFWTEPTVTGLSRYLVDQMVRLEDGKTVHPTDAEMATAAGHSTTESLSEEDLLALIDDELALKSRRR
jgi:acyl carrier protein